MKKPGLPEGRPGPFQPIGPCGPGPDLDQVLAGAAGASVGTPSEITPAPEQPPPVQPPVQPLVQPLEQQLRRQGRRQQRFARQQRARAQPQLGSAAQQLGPLSQQLAAQDGPASQAGSQQLPQRRPKRPAEAESAATRPTNTNANSIARIEKRFMRTSREKTERLRRPSSRHQLDIDPGRLPDRSTPKFEISRPPPSERPTASAGGTM